MLVHEAAHYLGDHPGTGSGNEAEVAAEGSAYVVMQRFVIDPGQYSFNYIAH